MTKKLCIIGGMGPLATQECYRRIIEFSPATKDQEHIETLIISDTQIPDRTESILKNDKTKLLDRFKRNFNVAENWGADLVIIPCNTSHYFMDEFKKITNIKIIDMVEETAKKANKTSYLFATKGTYMSRVYDKRFEDNNKLILPMKEEFKEISNETIYKIKKGEKPLLKNFPELNKIINSLPKDASIILACTELSLLDIEGANVIDAMDILCKKAVEMAYETD